MKGQAGISYILTELDAAVDTLADFCLHLVNKILTADKYTLVVLYNIVQGA